MKWMLVILGLMLTGCTERQSERERCLEVTTTAQRDTLCGPSITYYQHDNWGKLGPVVVWIWTDHGGEDIAAYQPGAVLRVRYIR